MKRLIFAALSLAALGLFAVTAFGDSLRALFGYSANALAGEPMGGDRHNVRFERKQLATFGSEAGGAQPSFVALAPNVAVPTRESHQSTFAIDVDTASYTYARQLLRRGERPDPASIRVEEWVNAFEYDLEAPNDEPFAIHVETADDATTSKTFLKVALQGRRVAQADRSTAHVVLLVDVSGSMRGPNRIELAKTSMKLMVNALNARDTVAIVTYAGATRVVLPPTAASNRAEIIGAIDSLQTGGGTNMGSGMELAYRLAAQQVRPGEVSRVMVLTDGDANIGNHQSPESILSAVSGYVAEGVTLTTVGFGLGNYRAAALEALADRGNGQALYIDSDSEAKKAFVTGLSGTLECIARDAKVQVDFDPLAVSSFRLIGYENRAVSNDDFRNDAVDGGELGAGHSVTAVYEVTRTAHSGRALGSVHVRGLHPDSRQPFEAQAIIESPRTRLDRASNDLRFALAVALAGDVLRSNPANTWSLTAIASLAQSATSDRPERLEFADFLRRIDERPVVAVHPVYDNNSY